MVMRKSRWIWILAIVLVVGGLGLGGVAHWTSRRVEAQAKALPPTLAWVPDAASMVGHVDLQSMFASPLGADWQERMEKHESFRELDEIRKAAGLDPQSDLNAATFCITASPAGGEPTTDKEERWGVAISGTFDSGRIVSALKQRAKLDQEDYRGTTIYRIESTEGEERALAFGDRSTLLLGQPSYVREMLDAGSGRSTSAGNGLMERWGESAFLEQSFWLAGSPDGTVASALSGSPGRRLPPLRAFSVSGRFAAELRLRGRGKAFDAKSAVELADLVRGVVALGRLQANADPGMSAIVDSIQIGQVDEEVEISLAVPYETLRNLSERAEAMAAEAEEAVEEKTVETEAPRN
jgi:hypothetical protein